MKHLVPITASFQCPESVKWVTVETKIKGLSQDGGGTIVAEHCLWMVSHKNGLLIISILNQWCFSAEAFTNCRLNNFVSHKRNELVACQDGRIMLASEISVTLIFLLRLWGFMKIKNQFHQHICLCLFLIDATEWARFI